MTTFIFTFISQKMVKGNNVNSVKVQMVYLGKGGSITNYNKHNQAKQVST